MFLKYFIFLFVFCLLQINLEAQIAPPGLGKVKSAFWLALGVSKKMNMQGTKKSVSYVAIGTTNSPEGKNPLGRYAALVLNQEFYKVIDKHQQYSYAFSYRRMPQYESKAPFDMSLTEQEIRIYGRYAYTQSLTDVLEWKNTLRQEIRKFYDADFKKVDENLEFRSRLETELEYYLSKRNKQKLSLGAEVLFGISQLNFNTKSWTPFQYKDTRLTLYYSFDINRLPITIDIGYMNDILRGNKEAKYGIHYGAIDFIWNIPY